MFFLKLQLGKGRKKPGAAGSCSCFQLFFLLRFKVGRKARIVKLTSEQGQATGRGMEVRPGSKSLVMAIVNRGHPPPDVPPQK